MVSAHDHFSAGAAHAYRRWEGRMDRRRGRSSRSSRGGERAGVSDGSGCVFVVDPAGVSVVGCAQ